MTTTTHSANDYLPANPSRAPDLPEGWADGWRVEQGGRRATCSRDDGLSVAIEGASRQEPAAAGGSTYAVTVTAYGDYGRAALTFDAGSADADAEELLATAWSWGAIAAVLHLASGRGLAAT